MKYDHLSSSEKGQSLLIISLAMVAFLALIAVVVDAGNDYVQRRQLQNSMDAAAQAGTLKLAVAGSRNGDVSDAVRNYTASNGTDPNRVSAYYVVQDGSGNNIVVRSGTVDTFGRNNPTPSTLNVSGSNYPVIGVQAEADRIFNTFFAGVIGFPQLRVTGASAAFANKGACSASGLFPLTTNITTFRDENGDGIRDIHYEQTDPTYTYQIFEKSGGQQNAPGNFGWLTWNGDPSANTLAANIQDTSRSGKWSVGDNIPGATGSMNSNSVRQNTQWYINNNVPVTIPIFDTVSGQGSNATYHIVGFARFHLISMNTNGNPKSITGKFQQWVDPQAEGGCTSFGVASVKVHPPINITRALVGTVKLQKLTIVGRVNQTNVHVPVDVVNVLDTSGSMSDSFGSTNKINAAKSALTSFNSNMQPSLGDQVALVTFPTTQSTSSYNYGGQSGCNSGSNSYNWIARDRHVLTANISSVNSTINGLSPSGWTPIASGLQHGRNVVLGTNHVASHVPVMIFASDGLANVLLNGHLTGFPGDTYSSPACNAGAVQDAVDQANTAKADANGDGLPDVIIYSIAVGTDFNPSLMQAIASTDTDPTRPHYFRATDASSMASIYQQIASQVQTIASECRIISTEAFAPNATVSIRFPNGSTQNVQTTSNGEFVLNNVASGTYQITGASVAINGLTYNIPTDGVGGPTISYPINVSVGTGSGTYKTDFALKTGTSVTCNQ